MKASLFLWLSIMHRLRVLQTIGVGARQTQQNKLSTQRRLGSALASKTQISLDIRHV